MYLYELIRQLLVQPTATVIWTHMIDFDFSAVEQPIYRRMSAEVKLYIQHHCHGPADDG